MSRTRGEASESHVFGEVTGLRSAELEAHQASLYAYSILAPSDNFELTLGFSYDTADDQETRRTGTLTHRPTTLTAQSKTRNSRRNHGWSGPPRGRLSERPSVISCPIRRLNPRPSPASRSSSTTLTGPMPGQQPRVPTSVLRDNVWMGAEYLHRSLEIPDCWRQLPLTWRGAGRSRLCECHRGRQSGL